MYPEDEAQWEEGAFMIRLLLLFGFDVKPNQNEKLSKKTF